MICWSWQEEQGSGSPYVTTTKGPCNGHSRAVTCTHGWSQDTKLGHCSHLLEEEIRNPQIKALPSVLEQGSLGDRRDAQPKTHFSPWLPLLLTSSLQDFLFPSFPK